MPYSCIKIVKVKITGYLHYIQKGLALVWVVLFLAALLILLFSSVKHYMVSNTYYLEGQSWMLMKLVFFDIICMCKHHSKQSKDHGAQLASRVECYIPKGMQLLNKYLLEIFLCQGKLLCPIHYLRWRYLVIWRHTDLPSTKPWRPWSG